tara:strand:- start:114 stop:683 length:570 start_codon:yes stop_codon:yes gene_type:complete
MAFISVERTGFSIFDLALYSRDIIDSATEMFIKRQSNIAKGYIKRNIKKEGKIDKGALERSVTSKVRLKGKNSNALVSVGGDKRVVYGWVIEKGRKPGTYPNIKRLRGWARRKLGINTRTKAGKRSVFMIARSIKRGTSRSNRPTPFFIPALRESEKRASDSWAYSMVFASRGRRIKRGRKRGVVGWAK